jgi:hypothetical protein
LTGLFELEEDEGCKFAVVFAPEDHGVLEETLEIVSNDPNHPSVFASLTGGTDIGLAGVYLYGDPTPAYYGFNILYLNDPEEILQGTFRITNYGAVSYTVTNILLGDILPADVVDASVITGQSGLCPHPPFALGGMGYCDFVIDLYLEKVGVFDGEVNLDIEPGGIEIQGYFDGDVRRSSSSSVCSISKPGAGTGTVHIVLLAVFLGGLYAWRRKRLP